MRLHNLSKLNVSHNTLATLPKMNSSTMKIIDLSYNNISQFSIADIDMSSNQNSLKLLLNLSKNPINAIDFTFLNSIKDHNLFERIGRYVQIDLSYNSNLTCDCDNMYFFKFIRYKSPFKKYIIVDTDTVLCASPYKFAEKPISEIDPNDFICPVFDQCPNVCSCFVQANVLTINCSNSNLTSMPIMPNNVNKFDATKLYIENNRITELSSTSHQSDFYRNITAIFAKNNRLSVLHSEHLPPKLNSLDVSANHFTQLGIVAANIFNKTSTLNDLMLSQNPWQCYCDSVYIQSHKDIISDYSQIECANINDKHFHELSLQDLCPVDVDFFIVSIVVGSIVGVSFGIMVALYYKYQQEIKVWLYSNNLCMRFVTETQLDKGKIYDAFLSYSHKDVDFVIDVAKDLEKEPHNFTLCLHDRDWMPGAFITDLVSILFYLFYQLKVLP